MTLDFPFALAALKLVAMMARVGAFVFAFPHFMDDSFPMLYKTYLVLGVCVVLYPVVPDSWAALLSGLDSLGLAMAFAMEAALGLLLAIVVMTFLMTFQFVGSQIGNALGLGMAATIDPVTGGNESGVISSVYMQLLMVSLLIGDFHLDFVAMAANSFHVLGPGQMSMDPAMGENLVALGGQALATGFMISMPVFAMDIFVNLALGFMSRVGEEFPVMLLSFPIKAMLAFTIMAAMVPGTIYYCRVASEGMLEWFAYILL